MLLRLALLFAVYLSLDFSNPLMPGAVSFGAEESVKARQAERPRGAEVSEAPPPLPTARARARPAEASCSRSRRPAPDVPCAWRALLQRSYPSLSRSAPPSDDA
jgi:hypothetical protein